MNWQPIETAPKDGTVILTDCAICLYVNPRDYGSPMEEGWHDCSFGGGIYDCADAGYYRSTPKFWMPLPAGPVT